MFRVMGLQNISDWQDLYGIVQRPFSRHFSSSHPFDSDQHYLLQVFEIGPCVESIVVWEDEWRHKSTIANDHPKHYDVDRVFGFH